jgi:hypothetical protein
MSHGTYIGKDKRFQGKKALVMLQVRPLVGREVVEAQFDDLSLNEYAHGWFTFWRTEFVLDKPNKRRQIRRKK